MRKTCSVTVISITLCTSFLFACAENSSTELTDAELTPDSIVEPDGRVNTMLDAGSSEPALDDRGVEDADDDGVRTSDAIVSSPERSDAAGDTTDSEADIADAGDMVNDGGADTTDAGATANDGGAETADSGSAMTMAMPKQLTLGAV